MSDIGNFSDLASIQANTVEKPKSLPAARPGGSKVQYMARISGAFKQHKSAKKGTLAARFPIRLLGAVDPEVQAMISSDEGLQKALEREYYLDFWLTPTSLFRLTEFAERMQVSLDQNIIELCEALVAQGETFTLDATLEPPAEGQEGDGFFKLDNPAPVAA